MTTSRRGLSLPRIGRYVPAILMTTLVVVGTACVIHQCVEFATADRRFKESQAIGEAVVAALEDFQAKFGSYPRALGQLKHSYTCLGRRPTWGVRKWKYETYGDSFTLTLKETEDSYECTWYDSEDGYWRSDF